MFRMADIRAASLAAHAAARKAKGRPAAGFAARAAGHAVGTAHVPQHAFGGAIYALKAMVAANPTDGGAVVGRERTWQARHLTPRLRAEFLKRVTIQKERCGVVVRLVKDNDF